MDQSYKGGCFCGAVQFEVTGAPALSAYCHCESCRHWAGAPISGFTLWKPETVKVTQGEGNIESFNKTPGNFRKWCKTCGGHLFTDHAAMGLIDIPSVVIPSFPFKPVIHVNYQESVMQVKDGLPKMKDLPKEAGGSGIEMEE